MSDVTYDDVEMPSSYEEEEEEEEIPPSLVGRKKRKAAPQRDAEVSKKGKTFLPDHSTTATNNGEEWEPRVNPLAKS